jgi:tellurite resistance protein TerC
VAGLPTFPAALDLAELAPWLAISVAIVALLLLDLFFFARGREPTFREGVVWSLGWLALSLLVALPVVLLDDGDAAVNYVTVYLIERSLSLDNLFVFLLLFGYFAVPSRERPRLLFWGIVLALLMRGAAILGGVALIQRFHVVIYILGVTLLILAYRVLRGVEENVKPERNLVVRATRRVFPVTPEFHDGHLFVRREGRRYATPLTLALAGVVASDIAFAVDSIPAAFAITRDSLLIWMGNAFALLGLRALFVLVEGLVRRFRYLDETIAVVLALVAVKLLLEDVYKVDPLPSLGVVVVAFTVGIVASVIADRRDPLAGERQRERAQAVERRSGRDGEPEEPSESRRRTGAR